MKNFIKNFSCLVFIAIFYFGGTTLLRNHYEEVKINFYYSPVYVTFVTMVFFGAIGVVLALSRAGNSDRRAKTLKIDYSKLLVLGLPSLILSMTHIWAQLGLFKGFAWVYLYISTNDYILILSSIVLGHTLISSLRMEDAPEDVQKEDVRKDTKTIDITIR
ncbi:hypothetical protein MKX50_12935 [Paenibacillus sp. FSL W8-0186]|uniref:Uncharacterized protein n=1 Tax=Paenibacillus woosongensis TaxID=307580 RepID=A0ABQ4MUC9_9BACL|nr:hypothetical protein [Paenibacillus woosongensis]GIP59515.1 hypothetical protein J15TS10_33290 [Paenibacillus woosongensis]